MDSILTSVKEMLGIEESYTDFDSQLIIYINLTFATLSQMGVGPETTFFITGTTEKWSDFSDTDKINMVELFVKSKVHVLFDPPQSSILLEEVNKALDEYGWRLRTEFKQY